MELGGLSGFNYCWHAVVGGIGEGVQVEGGAGSGAQPGGVQGRSPGGGFGGPSPRLSRNELKMKHDL